MRFDTIMQSIAHATATTFVVVLLFLGECLATVVRVPADQSSIQAALNNIANGDTVVVSHGTYTEELTAPNFGFSLLGDVAPDTGLFARPIVDPSGLFAPTERSCLKNLHGNVVIERMWFRNGPQMFPHDESVVGGIKNESANLFMRIVLWTQHIEESYHMSPVTLERCIFRKCTRNCVYMANAALSASDCDFECLNAEWSGIICGNGSVFEHNYVHGTAGTWDWMLAVGGGDFHVHDNLIGPCSGSRFPVARIVGPNGIFENNVITSCQNVGAMLAVQPQCDGMLEIRNNTFVDNVVLEHEFTRAPLFGVAAQFDSFTLCSQVSVTGNEIIGNRVYGLAKGLMSGGDNVIAQNIFRDLLPDSAWAVQALEGTQSFFENMFIDNEKAIESEYGYLVHAEYNYWGHASGPFHPVLNPLGQGDEVGDNVDFDPWYTDTLFNISSVEPRVPLPERASLVAYPNPFNAVTTLRLTLPRAGIARIELFDITGRRVRELWSGAVGETREIQFDGTDFASGMYFVRAWDPLGNRMWGASKIVILK